jgi:uncharacterized protein (DUF111 family)
MTRRLWCNPSLGVAGDMLLGALLDAGADEAFVRNQLERLELDGWSLEVEPTTRRGLVAARAVVRTEVQEHHRSWSHIDAMLSSAGLHHDVAAGARRTFRSLGDAEATVHGIDIDRVHFHEVGALDAIVDVVGSWAALVSLDVDEVVSAAVGLGSGTATMAHGTVPVPAPAVLELLVGVPTTPVEARAETATPTGVAVLEPGTRPPTRTWSPRCCSTTGTTLASAQRPWQRPCSRRTWTTSPPRCSPGSSSRPWHWAPTTPG